MISENFTQAQNLMRGVIAAARSRQFEKADAELLIENMARQRMLRTQLQARRLLTEQEYLPFHEWLAEQIEHQVPGLWRKPIRYDELGLYLIESPLPLERELTWASARLSLAIPAIREFRPLANSYEKALWSADYKRAGNILSVIEEKYGASIWVAEAIISLTQLERGLESQKKVADEIRRKAETRLPSFLAFYFSIRNEPATTVQGFSDRVDADVGRPGFTPSLRIFLKYRLHGLRPTTPGGWASILQIAQSTSTIDLYETVVQVLQYLAVEDVSGFHPRLREVISTMHPVGDPRMIRLGGELQKSQPISLPLLERSGPTALSAINARSVLKVALKAAKENPLRVNDINIAAIALSFGKLPSLRKSNPRQYVLSRLARLHLKGTEFEQAFNELQKFILNNSMSSAVRQLASIVENEGTPPSARSSINKKIKVLNTPHVDQRDSCGLFGPSEDAAIKGTKGSPQSPLETLIKEKSALTVEGFKNLAHDESLPRPLRISLSLALMNFALDRGDVSQAAEIASAEFVMEPEIRRVIPVDRILGLDGWKSLKPFAANIAVPILFDLAWRTSGDGKIATYRRHATQQFLTKNDCSKPSDLFAKRSLFDEQHLIYFLHQICVPTVLDMLPTLASSQDIDDERSAICAVLAEIDPAKSDIYHDEILLIANKKIVQAGLKVLDGSRIYVDQDSISRQAESELAEDYLRYKTLVSAGIGQSDKFENIVKMFLRATDSAVFELPDSEADALLLRMAVSVRQQFLFDAKYGLDSFLSQRIRHGTLQIYLRSPLEGAHLVTQRDSQTSAYVKNKYWLSRLRTLSPEQLGNVSRVFERFSDGFDKMLVRLKDQLFQVKSAEHPEGLFSLELNIALFLVLRSIAQQDVTLKEFISSCFVYFWALLDPSLRAARKTLQETFMTAVAKEFEILRAGLFREAEGDPGFADLSTAIGDASSKVQNEIDQVASWLNRQDTEQGSHRYTMEQAIEVAMHSALSAHRAFEPNVTMQVSADVKLAAGELAVIADIIRVAFGNISIHSGMGRKPHVLVKATLDETNEVLKFAFVNQIKAGHRTEENEQKLEELRAKIRDAKYSERVRKEGGSGFLKLANLVMQSEKGRIDFGYVDEEAFFLEVDVSFFTIPSFLRN